MEDGLYLPFKKSNDESPHQPSFQNFSKISHIEEHNYVRLPEGLTETPLKMIQMILKDAATYHKPVWILL